MRAGLELALVLVCASLGAVGTWWLTGPPLRVRVCDPAAIAEEEICLETLQTNWSADGFLWIDARRAEDWKRDGVEGSLHLTTLEDVDFSKQVEDSLERLVGIQRAVVYCGSSGCGISKEVVLRLRELGLIPEVRALHGGWDALLEAGLVKDSSREN
ncbi:MAG: hypothetical protein EAZ65_00095 [Verrucomicrobia bacterium]|nr:MAG: hypothetical protein EAZ84_10660 [Verrucomicrobiota bacterium]TAE89376.1 MAG: hypothetical protein EAZ82_01800 [Verrucomicrobiota bacterium]TAF27748.1 MAG: hypothetical protein EAZ71_00095 [Verrucomicrobiota bacterium]TAF42597.1 MAG: hypothetical protein EAZ65_00095 [Verrucomicrobiota bacterium]